MTDTARETQGHPGHRHGVTVIVDRRETRLDPIPRTGAELRAELHVPADRDLYEVRPHEDDQLITDETKLGELKDGTRFFTAPRHITPGRA